MDMRHFLENDYHRFYHYPISFCYQYSSRLLKAVCL